MMEANLQNQKKRQTRLKDLLLILVAAGIAIIIRYYFAPSSSGTYPGINGIPHNKNSSPPPSMDELWHLVLSSGMGDYYMMLPDNKLVEDVPAMTSLDQAKPWYSVWTTMDYVVHPPLYVQTLRLWRNVFGQSDNAAVAYSIFWSCIAVVICYLIVRMEASSEVALMSALMLAFSPPEIYFAIEIRGYAMLTAMVLILAYLTMWIRKSGATRHLSVLFSLSLLATMLTHYLALSTCLAFGILALIYARTGEKKRVIWAGLISATAYVIIWLPFLLRQAKHIDPIGDSYLANTIGTSWLIKIASITLLRLCGNGWPPEPYLILLGGLLLSSTLTAGCLRKSSRLIAIAAIITLLAMVIQDLIQHTWLTLFTRYCASSFALLIPTIFITYASDSIKYAKWVGSAITITFLAVVFLIKSDFPSNNDSPTSYEAAHSIAKLIESQEIIIICYEPDGYVQGRWMAMELAHIPGLFPRDLIIINKPITPELISHIRTNKAWLFPLTPTKSDPAFWLPNTEVIQRVNIHGAYPDVAYRIKLK